MPAADVRRHEPDGATRNPDSITDLPPSRRAQAGLSGTEPAAAGREPGTHQGHNTAAAGSLVDADLLDLVTRWGRLPPNARAEILEIARASS